MPASRSDPPARRTAQLPCLASPTRSRLVPPSACTPAVPASKLGSTSRFPLAGTGAGRLAVPLGSVLVVVGAGGSRLGRRAATLASGSSGPNTMMPVSTIATRASSDSTSRWSRVWERVRSVGARCRGGVRCMA
jgi:hypothetical protein